MLIIILLADTFVSAVFVFFVGADIILVQVISQIIC